MEVPPLEVYACDSNYAVVTPPGRQFPGSVVQGDSLRNLCHLAVRIGRCFRDARTTRDPELLGDVEELTDLLVGRLLHYQAVLAEHGIALPYAQPITEADKEALVPDDADEGAVPVPSLNLVVIRVADLGRAERFYSALGVRFTRERHGAGPEHLAADLGGTVFEGYPMGESASTAATRVGFRVASVAAALAAAESAGGTIVTPARDSPWGLRGVVADPDGHRVELVEEAKRAEPGAAPDRGGA